jgi:hypothetical protein
VAFHDGEDALYGEDDPSDLAPATYLVPDVRRDGLGPGKPVETRSGYEEGELQLYGGPENLDPINKFGVPLSGFFTPRGHGALAEEPRGAADAALRLKVAAGRAGAKEGLAATATTREEAREEVEAALAHAGALRARVDTLRAVRQQAVLAPFSTSSSDCVQSDGSLAAAKLLGACLGDPRLRSAQAATAEILEELTPVRPSVPEGSALRPDMERLAHALETNAWMSAATRREIYDGVESAAVEAVAYAEALPEKCAFWDKRMKQAGGEHKKGFAPPGRPGPTGEPETPGTHIADLSRYLASVGKFSREDLTPEEKENEIDYMFRWTEDFRGRRVAAAADDDDDEWEEYTDDEDE